VRPGAALPGDADLIVIPGSKATIADLAALRGAGFDIDIAAHRRRGGRVLGLCGGYQMLGRKIADPDGIEGPPGQAEGLGLLDVFGAVPVVGARPDAIGRLRDAGVAPVVWAHVGPTVAVECAPGRGAHVDEAVWEVGSRDGAVVLSPRSPRALPPGPYPITAGEVVRGACPCGRADARLLGLAP